MFFSFECCNLSLPLHINKTEICVQFLTTDTECSLLQQKVTLQVFCVYFHIIIQGSPTLHSTNYANNNNKKRGSALNIPSTLSGRQLLYWELVRVVIKGLFQPPLTPLDGCCYCNEAPSSPHFLFPHVLIFLPFHLPALSFFFCFTFSSTFPSHLPLNIYSAFQL